MPPLTSVVLPSRTHETSSVSWCGVLAHLWVTFLRLCCWGSYSIHGCVPGVLVKRLGSGDVSLTGMTSDLTFLSHQKCLVDRVVLCMQPGRVMYNEVTRAAVHIRGGENNKGNVETLVKPELCDASASSATSRWSVRTRFRRFAVAAMRPATVAPASACYHSPRW